MGDNNRASITIAGIALGACALGGIAYSLGWLGPGGATFEHPPPKPTTTAAASAPKTAAVPSDVVLLPGETLVAPAEPVVEAPKPPAPPAVRAPSPPKYAKSAPRRTPPPAVAKKAAPQYSREERRANSYERATRSVCLNCGVVTGITQGDYEWEVRVRFDDGTRKRLRYYDRPRVEIGDAVRLEDERLVRE